MRVDRTWKLPRPVKEGGEYNWKTVVRVGRHIPLAIDKTQKTVIYYYQYQ